MYSNLAMNWVYCQTTQPFFLRETYWIAVKYWNRYVTAPCYNIINRRSQNQFKILRNFASREIDILKEYPLQLNKEIFLSDYSLTISITSHSFQHIYFNGNSTYQTCPKEEKYYQPKFVCAFPMYQWSPLSWFRKSIFRNLRFTNRIYFKIH